MRVKRWLVYLLRPCEMGSDGWSGWLYHSVAFGDTDEEIYTNWVDNVRDIYNVDLRGELKCVNGKWSCYYPLCKCELHTSIYGHSEPISIYTNYRAHND